MLSADAETVHIVASIALISGAASRPASLPCTSPHSQHPRRLLRSLELPACIRLHVLSTPDMLDRHDHPTSVDAPMRVSALRASCLFHCGLEFTAKKVGRMSSGNLRYPYLVISIRYGILQKVLEPAERCEAEQDELDLLVLYANVTSSL